MMNRYNETGTIINFSARTYMNHKCICTYASDDEKFHAIIDDYGVMYSPDGKRLLDTVRQLKHYEVPEGVEVICDGAFCFSGLESIKLPDSLLAIGCNAFGNTRLTALTIPRNVRHIAPVNPIATNQLLLDKFECLSPYFKVVKGILYSKDNVIFYGAVTEDYPEELEILEGVKAIANGAMSHRAHLRSVSIPDSVTVMGDGAFHCSGVKKVKLSQNIDRIPAEYFYDCRLEVFIVPEGVVNVDDSALGHNDNLITVVFPKTLKNIVYNVFSGCPSLTRISAPRKSNFMNLKDMQKAGLRKGVRSTRENCIIDSYESNMEGVTMHLHN